MAFAVKFGHRTGRLLKRKRTFHHVGFHSIWIVLHTSYHERATVRENLYLLSETVCCSNCCGFPLVIGTRRTEEIGTRRQVIESSIPFVDTSMDIPSCRVEFIGSFKNCLNMMFFNVKSPW